jgi:hypothetical protein
MGTSIPGQSFGLAFDSSGNLFASDDVFVTIYKFTPEGVRSIFVGSEAFTSTQWPIVLAFDGSSNLFVSTADNVPGDGAILKFAPDGTKTTFATGLSDEPRGLTFDDVGNLFVAEVPVANTGDILKFTPDGTQTVFASGIGRTTGNGGPEYLAFTTGSITPPNSAVDLTFPNVTAPGITTVTPINPAPTPPPQFDVTDGNLANRAYEITTTVTYTASETSPIIIAFQVPPAYAQTFSDLRVLHNEGSTLVDATCPVPRPGPTPDPTTLTIYASVQSLSPFLIAKLKFKAQVQQPINPDGSSVFSVRRGVVPVKFTLTSDGVTTCQLSAATIAVARTAGGTIGSVNESVYSMSADSGSNFRIDSCQYAYNLNSSALGVGTYRVDIKLDNQVVGSAFFQLK